MLIMEERSYQKDASINLQYGDTTALAKIRLEITDSTTASHDATTSTGAHS